MKILLERGKKPTIVLISFLLSFAAFSAAATSKPPAHSAAPRAAAKSAVSQAPSATRNEELEGMKMDLARMKSLVQQMEVNIAQVDTTGSFLKHQFQLEIDAWKVMIASMQRRIEAMEKKDR